jgi:hypothetical protein
MIRVMMLAGPTATVVTMPGMCSRVTWTCREDASARSFMFEIGSAPCAVRNRARSQRSEPFESSPVVISEITTIVRLIRVRATFVICGEQGLVETTRVPGSRDYAVSLTKDGRSLLESHRDRDREGSQTFYAGVKRERELENDVQVYRAFEREAERLYALYRAIGQPHNRYRRPVAARRVQDRLMRLDAIVLHPELVWLGTEAERVAFFGLMVPSLPRERLPHITVGTGSERR